MLDADGKGVTLSVTEDPVLLLYDGGEATLAKELGTPAAALQSPPLTVAKHGSTTLTVAVNGGSAERIKVIAPPFWMVKKILDAGDPHIVHFTLTAPTTSAVREADFIVTVDNGQGRRQGELYFRGPVAE